MEPGARLYILTAATLLLGAAAAQARVLLTREEALALTFPAGTAVERRTAYLTREEALKVRAAARTPLDSRVWTYYVGTSSGGVEGYAYFETHVVRSMTETFMVALDARGDVRFVEMLAFHEPDDYLPPRQWLRQLKGKRPEDALAPRRDLANIVGATLTSHALAAGVRRILAVHAVVHGRQE